MRNKTLNVKSVMLLFAIVLLTYGVQGISYGADPVPTVTPGDDDTSLVVVFEDTWEWIQSGRSESYYIQARKKTPRGSWQSACQSLTVPEIPFPQTGTGTVTFTITRLDPGTTYEVRYNRDTDDFDCVSANTFGDFDGPWSAIGEGTTTGVYTPPQEPDPPEDDDSPDDEPPDGTTYTSGEVIPTLPSGTWFPNVTSGGSLFISGSGTTIELRNGGYIEQGGTRYTCVASGGCRIEGRRVTQGTIQVGGTIPPPVEQSDLVVDRPTVSENTLEPGESFTLSTAVRNQGEGRSDSTMLRYYRSTDTRISTSDTEVGTDRVSALGSGDLSAQNIRLTAPTSAGTYYYGACVEAVADENNSNNNCSAAVRITVEAIDPVAIPDSNLRAKIEQALGKAAGATITTADMANLTRLEALNANISDLTGLEHAINLERLVLDGEWIDRGFVNSNSVSDLSPLRGLTSLAWLDLGSNSISGISALLGLTNLRVLFLGRNSITDISALAGLTNLTTLYLADNSITDISAVSTLTNLTTLYLTDNSITDISALAGLTNLTWLDLGVNTITDISAVSTLTNLTDLYLGGNAITDISAVSTLTNLTDLYLAGNSITDISALADLTSLATLSLWDNSITDISALVSNAELGSGDVVDVSENPLNSTSINIHIPALQIRGVEVLFEDLKSTTLNFHLSVPAGTSLVHIPLKVTAVDGVPKTIASISDLYDALGGAGVVTFLITYDPATGDWLSYFGASDKGTATDRTLTDDMGIMANLVTPTTVRLTGDALGTDGSNTITLTPGLNLVGLPLNDSKITRVSDLFTLDGIRGNVPVIILTEGGDFTSVGRAGDPGDIPIVGGQGFILTAQRAATVVISGEGWTNTAATTAAAPMVFKGIKVEGTTSVLALRGAITDQHAAFNQLNCRVTVKNLSTGRRSLVSPKRNRGYRLTVVDIETGRAATIGDTLEIKARSPDPFIGVEPLRYTVTAEDVRRSLIQLPELVAYEIPRESQLLANYPNPFNPETWIPYRLAADALVTLTIYDREGQVVRTLDVGHQTAAVYESRSKAIYWDGRNEFGETVASGVYFYQLRAGDYSATRKMVILK